MPCNMLNVTLPKKLLYLPGMFREVVNFGNARFPGYNHLLTTGTSGYNKYGNGTF